MEMIRHKHGLAPRNVLSVAKMAVQVLERFNLGESTANPSDTSTKPQTDMTGADWPRVMVSASRFADTYA